RAGDTDELHIHLSVLNAPREVAKDDEEMMDLLRKTLPRWNTVTLHLNRRENVLDGFDQWTSLRSLSVTFLRQVSTTSFEPLFDSIDRSALQLKTLHISGDTREWAPYFQSVFPRLVSFTLQDSSLRCLGNIHWKNLQHLVLVHCAGALATMNPSPFHSGTTSFPALKTLTIHRAPAEVIQGFPLDTLKELSISDSEMTLSEVRLLPKLESLDLQLKASQMGFLTWLKTPNIKSFELKQVEPGDLNGNTPLAALTTFLNQNARMIPEQPPVNAQDEEESTDPSTSTAADATASPDASSSTIATALDAPTALTTELERTSAFAFRHVAIQDVVVDPSAFESVLKRSPNLEVLRIVPISLTAARKLLWLKEKQGTLAGDGPLDIAPIEPQTDSNSTRADNGPSDEVMGRTMDSIVIDTDTEMQIIEQEVSSDADRTSVELDLLGLDWCMPDTTTTTAASSQSGQIYSPTDFMDLPMDEGPSSIPTPELYILDDLPSSSEKAASSMTLTSTSTSAPLSMIDLNSPPSASPSGPKSMDDVHRASSADPPYHVHTPSVDPIPSSSMEISNSLPIELIPSSALSDSDMPTASTSVSTPTPITAATTPAVPTTIVASPSPETTDKTPPPPQVSPSNASSQENGGQYVAPALHEIKIRILPYALYVEEDAEATLRKELEEVAKERTENGLPLSVKIFRNIVK
ncbi:3694_t:CDS:1, partial [Acaulospora colombiana]